MDLILWRHADAQEPAAGMTDMDRPLTPKGQRQAQRMARWLAAQLPESTRVLASPSLRTRQTAEALQRKVRVLDALGPEAGVEALLQAARWPDARGPVLVVGHQPALGMAAGYLLTGSPQAFSLRKGAVWWLRQRERQERSEVVLHLVLAPDSLG